MRQALGVERISLLGVSYGTKVALGYAVAHPDRVERLVLDSPVALEGPDPFGRSGMAALPRVLADLCRGRRCRGVTRDPLGDLGRLAGRLRVGPLRGTVVGSRGQRRQSTLRESGLLGLLLASDIDPTLLPALPAATSSALRGDGAPILRLARTAAAAEAPERPDEFSTALLVATLCEEAPLPWSRTAALDQRRAELDAAAESLGDAPFAPFGRAAAIAVSLMPACLGWPAAPVAPSLAGPAPAAPTMLVDGSNDLRTPLEDGRAIAATLPNARILEATGVGHSVLSATTSKCPGRALGAFFAGRPVRRSCPRDQLLDIPPDPIAPLSLREVAFPPGLGGRPGRTLGAVLLTFSDTGAALLSQLPSAIAEIVERGTAERGRPARRVRDARRRTGSASIAPSTCPAWSWTAESGSSVAATSWRTSASRAPPPRTGWFACFPTVRPAAGSPAGASTCARRASPRRAPPPAGPRRPRRCLGCAACWNANAAAALPSGDRRAGSAEGCRLGLRRLHLRLVSDLGDPAELFGRYQFQSPRSFIVAGSSTARTSVASMRTAAARPTPICFMSTMLSVAKVAKTPTMMIAALVTVEAVALMPCATASSVFMPLSNASRTRVRMNTW